MQKTNPEKLILKIILLQVRMLQNNKETNSNKDLIKSICLSQDKQKHTEFTFMRVKNQKF